MNTRTPSGERKYERPNTLLNTIIIIINGIFGLSGGGEWGWVGVILPGAQHVLVLPLMFYITITRNLGIYNQSTVNREYLYYSSSIMAKPVV